MKTLVTAFAAVALMVGTANAQGYSTTIFDALPTEQTLNQWFDNGLELVSLVPYGPTYIGYFKRREPEKASSGINCVYKSIGGDPTEKSFPTRAERAYTGDLGMVPLPLI